MAINERKRIDPNTVLALKQASVSRMFAAAKEARERGELRTLPPPAGMAAQRVRML